MNKNYKKILSLKRKEEYLANLIENSLNLFDTVERAIYEFGYEHCLTFLMNSSINKNIVFEKAHVDNSLINILDSGIQDGLDNISKINYTKNVTLTNKYTRLVGENKIFYGIPGCGKSYYIEHKVLDGVDKKHNVFRTTFYLDYSNSDFIGQIYPKTVNDENGKTRVLYENVPGPFTKALKRAFEKPDKMIYLVIEEINRGNAAAIFGDTFQLLDRLTENYDGRVVGDSEYPISNEFIEDFLGEKLVKKGCVYIPHNLTILATMNTSDQNVFPLDTAFKRRWDRERVVSDWSECDLKNMYIPFTDITWEYFVETMNTRMMKGNVEIEATISEDKKIGAYFARKDMLSEINNKDEDTKDNRDKLKKFVNNVIDYLYNDVTKFDHSILFKDEISYDEIYKVMIEYKKDNNQDGLFKNILKEDIVPNNASGSDDEK